VKQQSEAYDSVVLYMSRHVLVTYEVYVKVPCMASHMHMNTVQHRVTILVLSVVTLAEIYAMF